MVAYQKHSDDETRPKSHFQELKDNQKKVQMDFHAKLFQELAKESTEGGKPSAVAEALGTSYEVRKSNSTHHVHPTGYNSVPSKSPNMSRRGSSGHLNTWMSKSPFWSNSLPRQKRRVKGLCPLIFSNIFSHIYDQIFSNISIGFDKKGIIFI